MAENLADRGIKVTIIEMMNQVLNVMDFEMAAFVRQQLKENGVELYIGQTVISFEEEKNGIKAALKSGIELSADMVLLSIGVKPDIKLAEEAGLEIGLKQGIIVNEYLQTSDPNIYSVGDAIETINLITGKSGIVPLAGPANKQGRIAAGNIVMGNSIKNKGVFGTAIAKVFNITAGVTGATEKLLKQEGIPYLSSITHSSSHAAYYPNAISLAVKILFSPDNGRLLGAQIVGKEGVDKRIDVFSAMMMNKNTIYDLEEFEQAYAPPYSSAKDPLTLQDLRLKTYLQAVSKLSAGMILILTIKVRFTFWM